MDLSVLASSE
uniref:Uncharacterized protein n=1 Tax=Rhizophora mucronata TaxID=61149 RepID=A0A2P2PY98_RHIMU